jgi:hypothetical protein
LKRNNSAVGRNRRKSEASKRKVVRISSLLCRGMSR